MECGQGVADHLGRVGGGDVGVAEFQLVLEVVAPVPLHHVEEQQPPPSARASLQVSPELVTTRSAAAISAGTRSVWPKGCSRGSRRAAARSRRSSSRLRPATARTCGPAAASEAAVRASGPSPQEPDISRTHAAPAGTPSSARAAARRGGR